MSSTPKQTNVKGNGRLQHFKSPLGQLFKSPMSSTMGNDKETKESLQNDIDEMRKKLKDTETEIQKLCDEGYEEEELQCHISKLHEYNEIKDTGQMLLGRIADMQGVRTKDLYEKYGLNLED